MASKNTVLMAKPFPFQDTLSGGEKVIGKDGFDDVVRRARLDAFHCRLDGGVTGNEYDRQIRVIIMGHFEELHPAHLRHSNIRDKEIERLLRQQLGGTGTSLLGNNDGVRNLAQDPRASSQYRLFVVNDQDAQPRHIGYLQTCTSSNKTTRALYTP